MHTDYPSKEIFFVFAYTYCKVKVYETEFEFCKKILENCERVEILNRYEANAQEIDARLLIYLVSKALPKMVSQIFPKEEELLEKFAIKPS